MKYKDLTEEQLNEEFIQWFGEEKLKQEEILAAIIKEELLLTTYTHLEPIPVIFEHLEEAYAHFNVKEGYITLSDILMTHPRQKVLESFLHEYCHFIQVNAVLDNIDLPIVEGWRKELTDDYDFTQNIVDYYLSALEIGAYAFAQSMMEIVYELSYTRLPEGVQEIVDEYKQNNNVLDLYLNIYK